MDRKYLADFLAENSSFSTADEEQDASIFQELKDFQEIQVWSREPNLKNIEVPDSK